MVESDDGQAGMVWVKRFTELLVIVIGLCAVVKGHMCTERTHLLGHFILRLREVHFCCDGESYQS
jgi:hypothetical protein